jgi:hypothetical protein
MPVGDFERAGGDFWALGYPDISGMGYARQRDLIRAGLARFAATGGATFAERNPLTAAAGTGLAIGVSAAGEAYSLGLVEAAPWIQREQEYEAAKWIGRGSAAAGYAAVGLRALQLARGYFLAAGAATAANPEVSVQAVPKVGNVLSAAERAVINDVFRGRSPVSALEALGPGRREAAIAFYRQVAGATQGKFAEAARLFNLERARFLEQGGPLPPGTLMEFMERLK